MMKANADDTISGAPYKNAAKTLTRIFFLIFSKNIMIDPIKVVKKMYKKTSTKLKCALKKPK